MTGIDAHKITLPRPRNTRVGDILWQLGLRGMRLEIVKAIITFKQQHGFSPTNRELAEAVGLRSINTVNHHL